MPRIGIGNRMRENALVMHILGRELISPRVSFYLYSILKLCIVPLTGTFTCVFTRIINERWELSLLTKNR